MTDRILFACLGNICRSPLAEGIARQKAHEAGLSLFIDSAGIGSWHIGKPPDPRGVVSARTRGYDISDQKARIMRPQDFSAFDMIVAMDGSVLREVEDLRPAASQTPVVMMTSWLGTDEDVPDPYYSGRFDPVVDLLERAVDKLIAQLLAEQ